jgi:hypothetical protein
MLERVLTLMMMCASAGRTPSHLSTRGTRADKGAYNRMNLIAHRLQ